MQRKDDHPREISFSMTAVSALESDFGTFYIFIVTLNLVERATCTLFQGGRWMPVLEIPVI